MAGFLDFINKVAGNNKSFPSNPTAGTLESLSEHKVVSNSTLPKQLVYPHDLFDPSKGSDPPWILFVVRDPISRGGEKKNFIAMYLPPQLTVNYGAVYETIELTLPRLKNIATAVKNGKLIGNDLIVVGTNFVLGNDSVVAQQFERAAGKTLNPHQASIFKNVDFRAFSFEFQMMARNRKEADDIRDIIQVFKEAMHPGQSDGGESIFWEYPDNFDIFLFTPSEDRMFKIQTSVLENMSVNYGGSGIPSFFVGPEHAPVDIRMTLNFKELSVLTKEKIRQGF